MRSNKTKTVKGIRQDAQRIIDAPAKLNNLSGEIS
jgi:hypothetical protein